MKNVILVSVAIMAASFASCSQANSTKGEENVPCDSVYNVDSVSEVDTTNVAENKSTAHDFDIDSSNLDSVVPVAVVPHSTCKYNDAAIFGLRGHVKKCVTVCDDNYTLATTRRFRRNGSWITDFSGYKVTRDKNNQLISMSKNEIEIYGDNNRDTCKYTCSQTFTWKKGLLTASETVEEQDNSSLGLHFTYYLYYYEYDKNGLVRQEIYSDGKTYAETYTYKYLEFDSKGNWIKREVEAVSNSDKPLGTHIETRKITYYK